MYYLFFISIAFALFLNTNIGTALGFSNLTTMALLPMAFYIAITLCTQKFQHYSKIAISLLILAIVILLFKWTVGQNYAMYVGQLLIVPSFMYICFEHLTKQQLSMLRCMMILFFILFCVLAIAERVMSRHFFPVMVETMEWEMNLGFFRSKSLFNHPLHSAYFVAVTMAYMVVAEFKKKYFQVFLFFLGYLALFCFDGRVAILTVTLIILPYFILKLYKTAGESRWMITLGVICVLFGMVYIVSNTSVGSGRLMGIDLMDSSGQSRLEVFDFYKHYKHENDFLWGHPDNKKYIKDRLGAAGIENGIIAFILEFGIILTPILLFSLFLLQYISLSVFSKFDQWILLLVFFVLGSSNPHLAAPINWIYWVLTYFAYKPENP